MEKKNVIHILVDALSYDNIGERYFRKTPTPFLDSLKSKSIYCEKLYTQGPYTEAAFISGFCGENTLDHGGYMLGLSGCRYTYPTIYKENGYRTLMTYSPYIQATSYVKNVDEYFYSRMYSLAPLVLYRFEHFAYKFKNNILENDEIRVCIELMEDAFCVWLDRLKAILEKKDSVLLILDLINDIERAENVYMLVNNQYNTFLKDKETYIKELFHLWKSHDLFQIENLTIQRKQSNGLKQYIDEEFNTKIEEMQKIQNQLNKSNNTINWKYLLNILFNDEDGWRAAKRTYRSYKELFNSCELIRQFSMPEEKVTISAYRQLDLFQKRILELDKDNENFYCFIHLEDFHLPSMFFTYDIDDRKIISEELEYAYEYAKSLPKNYRGNLLADLSSHYIDKKLSIFFNTLKEKLKNDYIFVVTADHGYPSNYNPPRPLIYNSFYQENYHIPLIIFDSKSRKQKKVKGLFSSLDVMPLILSKSNITKEYPLSSYEILSDNDRNYILIEYPGPGCPEISTKKIYYAIYDGKYKVGFKEYLNQDITTSSVNGIFDLQNDPYELINMKNKKKKEIEDLIEIVNRRHQVLRRKFGDKKFYSSLIKKESIYD